MHTRRYTAIVFTILVVLLLGSVLFGIGSGSVSLSPTQVIDGLFGGAEQRVVWDLRLPRVILGGLVGMSLAVSGLILQAVMMNPLADPGLSVSPPEPACSALSFSSPSPRSTPPYLFSPFVAQCWPQS